MGPILLFWSISSRWLLWWIHAFLFIWLSNKLKLRRCTSNLKLYDKGPPFYTGNLEFYSWGDLIWHISSIAFSINYLILLKLVEFRHNLFPHKTHTSQKIYLGYFVCSARVSWAPYWGCWWNFWLWVSSICKAVFVKQYLLCSICKASQILGQAAAARKILTFMLSSCLWQHCSLGQTWWNSCRVVPTSIVLCWITHPELSLSRLIGCQVNGYNMTSPNLYSCFLWYSG